MAHVEIVDFLGIRRTFLQERVILLLRDLILFQKERPREAKLFPEFFVLPLENANDMQERIGDATPRRQEFIVRDFHMLPIEIDIIKH